MQINVGQDDFGIYRTRQLVQRIETENFSSESSDKEMHHRPPNRGVARGALLRLEKMVGNGQGRPMPLEQSMGFVKG